MVISEHIARDCDDGHQELYSHSRFHGGCCCVFKNNMRITGGTRDNLIVLVAWSRMYYNREKMILTIPADLKLLLFGDGMRLISMSCK